MATITKKNIFESQAKPQSENNPYAGIDPQRQLTRLQQFLDSIGITNYGRNAQYQHDLASNQWESQNAQLLEDRDYNDYIAQVQRMKVAGLNPDFQEVPGGSSELGSNSASSLPGGPVQPFNPLSNLFDSLMSGLTTAMSVYSGVLDIQRKSEENLNMLLQPFIDESNDMSLEQFMKDYRTEGNIPPALKFDFSGMSKLQQKKANRRMAEYLGSSSHENAILKRYSDSVDVKENYLTKKNSYSNTDPVGFESLMRIISKNTSKVLESDLYKRIASNNYETKGFNYGLANDSYRHKYNIEANQDFISEKQGEAIGKSIQEQDLNLDLKRWQAEMRRTKLKICEDMLRDKNPMVKLQGLTLFNTLFGIPDQMQNIKGVFSIPGVNQALSAF